VIVAFKENLKKKILTDRLSQTVCQSIGSPGSMQKIDKESMRKLLALTPFVSEKRRDLELYFRELEPGIGEVISLDNELPLYGKTNVDDVALRRSPEVKEMVHIRNIIKILSDKDIRICKGSDTVLHVQNLALGLLDLSFSEEDVQVLVDDGIDAVAREDSDAVLETLELFVELLGYRPVPAAVGVRDYVIYGDQHEGGKGRQNYGPIVMYNDKTNVLKMIKNTVSMDDPRAQTMIPGVALGEIKPDAEGIEVFRFLKQAALAK
jgi:hypothetical protein